MKGPGRDVRRPPSTPRWSSGRWDPGRWRRGGRRVPSARPAGRAGRDNVEPVTVQRNSAPAIRATVSDSTYARPDAAHLPTGRRPDADQRRPDLQVRTAGVDVVPPGPPGEAQ